MNILRELRRAKKKSMATRVILISIFSVILIVNTYAWFSSSKNVTINGLEGQITSWDVAYYVDGKEILDQDVAFTIDELYPGMPNREDVVHIYNLGKTSTRIKYEIKSIKVYGKEVLDQIQAEGGIQTSGNALRLERAGGQALCRWNQQGRLWPLALLLSEIRYHAALGESPFARVKRYAGGGISGQAQKRWIRMTKSP